MDKKDWEMETLRAQKDAEVTEKNRISPAKSIVEGFKVNDKTVAARATLAAAMIEDEVVRDYSYRNSRAYLERIDEEDSRTPFWMFAVLYFILGMLFIITVDNISYGWEDMRMIFEYLNFSKQEYATVALTVERLICNQRVGGSNPLSGSIKL